MSKTVTFEDIVNKKEGFLRGPFGGDLKKEIFVPKAENTYKVYEQGVVLQKNPNIGDYYITKEYFDKKMYRFEVKPKDFLVSCSGVNYGAIYQLEDIITKGVINQALLRIRLNKDIIDDDYFYYLFQSYIVKMIVGKKGDSTIPNFPAVSILKKLKFQILDLEIQKKVGGLLKIIDSKIELNNKINTELEAMAKTLYDYWFVQFDFPDENGKPYKSSGGEMVWSEELKREIPKGREVKNLKNNSLTNLIKPNIDFFEGEKTYLATADIVNNEINFGADKITFENRESRANMQPIQYSIWFAKMKNTKKVLYVGEYSNYFLENFILSTGFSGLKCKKSYYLEYVWGFINNDNFEIIKDRLSNGATQEAINNDSMAFIPLIIPSENILKEYHKKTFEIYKKIYLNQIENQKLAELRDFLLPMLMNGQVVVE